MPANLAPNVIDLPRRRPKPTAKNLTEASIRNAEARARTYYLADGTVPGLTVKVRPTGNKTFVLRSRIGQGRGAPRADFKIGTPGAVSLSAARDAARDMLGDLRRGIDPRLPKPGAAPVGELLDAYDTDMERRGIVNRQHVMSTLRRGLVRHRHRPIGEITRLDITTIIDAIEARGLPGAARDFRSRCAAFLSYVCNRGHLAASPLAGYRRARQTRAERLGAPGLTFTGGNQVRRLWGALGRSGDPIMRDMLRLLLLTGQRRGEAGHMTHDDVDFDHPRGPRWTIPGARRKSGEPQIVPLGPLSAALLRNQPRHAGIDLVFPSLQTGRTIMGWSTRLLPIREALGEPRFAPHSLRRTYRSALSDLDVDMDTAERMIGHARPGLLGIYDKSLIWARRVDAQNAYEAWIAGLTASPEAPEG